MSDVLEPQWSDEFLEALVDPTPGRLMRVIRAISTRPDLWQPGRNLVQMAQHSIASFDAMAWALASGEPLQGEG